MTACLSVNIAFWWLVLAWWLRVIKDRWFFNWFRFDLRWWINLRIDHSWLLIWRWTALEQIDPGSSHIVCWLLIRLFWLRVSILINGSDVAVNGQLLFRKLRTNRIHWFYRAVNIGVGRRRYRRLLRPRNSREVAWRHYWRLRPSHRIYWLWWLLSSDVLILYFLFCCSDERLPVFSLFCLVKG